MLGVVEKATDDKLEVKIADGIVVTVYRATVRQMAEEDEAPTKKVSKNKNK